LDLSANTGRNSTNDNTNGNNDIETGDAAIVANLVNFVNNNITGGGKLFVTVVNVFGSWLGDFVGPGHEKEEELAQTNSNHSSDPAIGGSDVNPSAPSHETNATQTSQSVSNPTPTPTTGGQQTHLAFGGSITSGGGPGIFILGSTTQPQEEQSTGATVGGRRKITINLAYLLLALPFAIFFIVRRRITLPHISLPLKRIASALHSLL
jgi:hypothetical protein